MTYLRTLLIFFRRLYGEDPILEWCSTAWINDELKRFETSYPK
jgi:hypothetical protein